MLCLTAVHFCKDPLHLSVRFFLTIHVTYLVLLNIMFNFLFYSNVRALYTLLSDNPSGDFSLLLNNVMRAKDLKDDAHVIKKIIIF